MIHPTDVALLGLALDIAGAVVLARGFITKALPDMFYESRTVFDGNAFLLRSGMLQRAEAWGGAVLLMLGFLLQMLGALHVFPNGALRRLVGWLGAAALVAVAAVMVAATLQVTGHVGRKQFYEYKLRNYSSGEPFKADTVEDKQELLRCAVLYDIAPRQGQTAASFAERLTKRVDRLGTKYRGKVARPDERARSWE